jgi:hypothetical protein
MQGVPERKHNQVTQTWRPPQREGEVSCFESEREVHDNGRIMMARLSQLVPKSSSSSTAMKQQ